MTSEQSPGNKVDLIFLFGFRERKDWAEMAERKRAQAAKAMEKKTMNPKASQLLKCSVLNPKM